MSSSGDDLHSGVEQAPSGNVGMDPVRMLRRRWQRPGTGTAIKRRYKMLAIAGCALVGVVAVITLSSVIWFKCNKLPNIRLLATYTPVQAVNIYDGSGKLAAVVSGEEDRRPVKLSQVSTTMRLAMIGAEDHDFYHHGGINPSSILRALVVNLAAGRIVEGGSTITQQLVKNLFFPGEKRTFNRKIKEFFLARDVAAKYSKNKILEMYLNQIYFGNQSYGIEAAAQRYFNKAASRLTLGESTFLAGLVKAPSLLSNPDHRQEAFKRQYQVLDQMVGYGMLTKAQAERAKQEKLAFRKFVNPYQKFPYYVSYVMDELRDHYGEQELQHGLNVYTCLDPAAEAGAEKTMNQGIKHAPAGVTQGALVSVRVNDGGVVALVGGVGGFEHHQWNRAISPHTMGSCFKPFVYLTGFLHGLTPGSILPDTPFSGPSGGHIYTPRNFDNKFMGPLTVMQALTFSRNVCAVRLAAFCGINNVIETAHLAGLTSKLDPYLPTAIGACAASPLDMAGAYCTFARGGIYLTPHLIRRIDSPQGKHVYVYDEKPHKVFDSQAVTELVDCMQNVVAHGTGIFAQLPGHPVAGKTGTADKARDIWFVGFTPDTCTAVWGGNDNNKGVSNPEVTGGMVMAGIWKQYMLAYYDKHPTPAGSFMIASKAANSVPMSSSDATAARNNGITPIGANIAEKNAASAKGGTISIVVSKSATEARKLIARKSDVADGTADEKRPLTDGSDRTQAGNAGETEHTSVSQSAETANDSAPSVANDSAPSAATVPTPSATTGPVPSTATVPTPPATADRAPKAASVPAPAAATLPTPPAEPSVFDGRDSQ